MIYYILIQNRINIKKIIDLYNYTETSIFNTYFYAIATLVSSVSI